MIWLGRPRWSHRHRPSVNRCARTARYRVIASKRDPRYDGQFVLPSNSGAEFRMLGGGAIADDPSRVLYRHKSHQSRAVRKCGCRGARCAEGDRSGGPTGFTIIERSVRPMRRSGPGREARQGARPRMPRQGRAASALTHNPGSSMGSCGALRLCGGYRRRSPAREAPVVDRGEPRLGGRRPYVHLSFDPDEGLPVLLGKAEGIKGTSVGRPTPTKQMFLHRGVTSIVKVAVGPLCTAGCQLPPRLLRRETTEQHGTSTAQTRRSPFFSRGHVRAGL